jgi:hypothetical protein
MVMWAKHLNMCCLTIGFFVSAPLATAQRPATGPTSQPSSRPVIVVAKPPAKDAAVLEAALRETLSRAKPDETTFVSLGSVRTKWKDPPPEFLKRFDDLKLELRPVSAARHPERGEMESPNQYRGIEDPDTGKRSWVHWAEVTEWLSDTKARVDTGVWSGPLGGGGSTDIYELRDGKWLRTGSEGHWVS